MNTAQYIVKRLEELGINDFFGISGDYNFNLLYAVNNNPNTKWIGCTNSLNAAYAADGYARIRGYGAVISAYGGELGTLNAAAISAEQCVPVVYIVGLPSTKQIKNDTQYHIQTTDYKSYIDSFSSIVATTALLSKENAKQEIDRALKTMVKERKPIYIAIPSDVAKQNIENKYTDYDWISDKDKLNSAAEKIAEIINKSKKPVIIGDSLIKRFDAEIEYKEFVKRSGIPVSNFLSGLNIIEMDYEKYIGGYFGGYRNPIAQKYIEDSDCLISVGTVYNNVNAFGFKLAKKVNNGIAIYGTKTYINGKLYDNVKMTELLETVTSKIASKNIEIDKPLVGYKQKAEDIVPLTSDYVYTKIQNFIKENDIIVTELGSSMYGVAQMKFPANVDLQFQTSWGTIGWATPATLGTCLAKSQARVFLITGEGAHQQTCMEIGTMLRNGIKPIVIVMNNNGYSSERLLCRDSKDSINDVLSMSYAKLARLFEGDIWSTKVTTSEDFDKALKVTQIMNKMCYIEVCTDTLDIPLLIQDILYTSKDKVEDEKQTEEPQNTVDEILTTAETLDFNNSSIHTDFAYETIVHKGINEINPKSEDIQNE